MPRHRTPILPHQHDAHARRIGGVGREPEARRRDLSLGDSTSTTTSGADVMQRPSIPSIVESPR
ncbi:MULTISPECIES: hypothetical protein [Methylobacterium]|uniref:hypothetical protein n=1 Tax=Methylobacterium TaxID=407 RepID=UPI0013ECD8F6|nr:hypothetical protein [Methylobacterium sp. DB0501]NGM38388.1 hypothetical protein [Methylobacterium sp. DB0501]